MTCSDRVFVVPGRWGHVFFTLRLTGVAQTGRAESLGGLGSGLLALSSSAEDLLLNVGKAFVVLPELLRLVFHQLP
jgi:hypothetical protein